MSAAVLFFEEAVMEEKRICLSCGAESEPGSNFCAACGKPLPKTDEPGEKQPGQERQGENAADRQAETADRKQTEGAAEAETITPEAAKAPGEEDAAPPLEKSSPESAPRTDDALNNVRLAGLAGGALLALDEILRVTTRRGYGRPRL